MFKTVSLIADGIARGLLRAAEFFRDVEEWASTGRRWSAIRERRAFITEHILQDLEVN